MRLNFILLIFFYVGCSDVQQPKPKGALSLSYPEPKYQINYSKKKL